MVKSQYHLLAGSHSFFITMGAVSAKNILFPHTTSIDRVFDLLGQILEDPPIINPPFQTIALVTNLLCHYFDDAHLLYIRVSF
jgi:hypothetical protein